MLCATALSLTLSACGSTSSHPKNTATPTPAKTISPMQRSLKTACLQINSIFSDGSILRTGETTREQRVLLGYAAENLAAAARINPQYLEFAQIALEASQGATANFSSSRNIRNLQALCLDITP